MRQIYPILAREYLRDCEAGVADGRPRWDGEKCHSICSEIHDSTDILTKEAADLVEVAFVHGLSDVSDLAALVGLPLLFVELLRQRLQLGQGHLQRKTVGVAHRCVLQHVLFRVHSC